MKREERLSVRELITALARLEDELRTADPPLTDDADRQRRLEARELAILEELHSRSPDVAGGRSSPVSQCDSALEPDAGGGEEAGMPLAGESAGQAAGESAVQALAGDPDAGRVGGGAEGEDLGEGLLGTRRVPQDEVGGGAGGRS